MPIPNILIFCVISISFSSLFSFVAVVSVTLILHIFFLTDFIFAIFQWDVTSTPPKSSACDVTIGLRINTDHAEEILDMGPPADDPKVFCSYLPLFRV